MYAENPRNFNMGRFSWPNHLILPFCLIRRLVAFKSSTKFLFSTSCDLNTAKLTHLKKRNSTPSKNGSSGYSLPHLAFEYDAQASTHAR